MACLKHASDEKSIVIIPDLKDIPAEIFQLTSQSEFGQGNDLTRNTGGAAKVKGAHRFLQGVNKFYRSL